MVESLATHMVEYVPPAWNDGKIRGFTPETGKLKLMVNNAHSMGVTAIAITKDSSRIVSGGGEGQVRLFVSCLCPTSLKM